MADPQSPGQVCGHRRDVRDRKSLGDDAWKAFPEQRLRLLETIRAPAHPDVFIISGDVRLLTSRLTHSADPDFESAHHRLVAAVQQQTAAVRPGIDVYPGQAIGANRGRRLSA